MKRRAGQVVVFLLLGAIVNVAVAWALLTLPSRFEWKLYRGEDWMGDKSDDQDRAMMQTRFSTSAIDRFDCRVTGSRRLGWTLKQLECRPSFDKFPDDQTYYRLDYIACGLPFRCLIALRAWGSEREFQSSGQNQLTSQRDELPTRPIWPGFAINTIFYAAMLWVVFALPFVLRRRRRIKRGQCPACAYPVGASPVCTECGKPVKPSAISGQQSARPTP